MPPSSNKLECCTKVACKLQKLTLCLAQLEYFGKMKMSVPPSQREENNLCTY